MSLPDFIKGIADRVQNSASVKSVYGDPIVAEGKTIIPVARVKYGFGGGGGSGTRPPDPDSGNGDASEGMGGGGGGGVSVTPVGMIEITPGETRYVSFEDRRRIIGALLIGFLVALFLLRRRRGG